MASLAPPLSSHLSLTTLVLILVIIQPAFATSRRALDDHQDPLMKTGFKITLNNIDSGGKFTASERLYRAVQRSNDRLQKFNEMILAAHDHPKLSTPVHAGVGLGEFLMDFSIGTPPKSYSGTMDTGSDLIWTQCQPCLECFAQPVPLFDPKESSTFSNESCSSKLCLDLPQSNCNPSYECVYNYTYGSGSTSGFLGTETFTFGKVSVPKIAFGCGLFNEGAGFIEGLIGIGRGPLSLISQLREREFSYCLTSYGENKSSTLLIGTNPSVNSIGGGRKNKTTPLIPNPKSPTFYYVSLEGITVGSTKLPINKTTFAINSDGSGGVIIDSGTTITQLESSAYLLVRKEFIEQVKLPVVNDTNTIFDLCFKLPANPSSVVIPKLVFHFTDVDIDLPTENYMVGNSSIFVPGLGVTCLAMGSSGFGLSILGNILQQNFLVEYDLFKETLSFTPTQCDKF